MHTEKALQQATKECQGIRLNPIQLIPYKPVGSGCGAPTNVEGTNGGKMPCGALLTRFGKTAPYYCGLCENQLMKG